MLPRCAAFTAVCLLASCGTSSSWTASPARTLSLAEFAADAGSESASSPELATGQEAVDATAEPVIEETAAAPPDSAAAEPPPAGSAAAPPVRPLEPGDSIHVDSLVGQVNGRPLFADTFFQPIQDELVAKARTSTPREFILEADKVISNHLREIVRNDLVLAEAESGLTEEQQAGLLAWLRETQRETVRLFGPTRSTAEQRLLEEEGITLEEFMRRRRDAALIQDIVVRQIRSRVVVSWRDIEREYERNLSKFQPPARVTLSRIRLFTEGDAELIEDVRGRLQAGEAFTAVAGSIGPPKAGTYDTFVMGPGGVSDIEVAEPIRTQLEGLEVGGTTEPFVVGSTTWWLHVDSVEQPPGRSLFDPAVQQELTTAIFNRRYQEEEQRYFQSLLERGIVDNLDAMKLRLLELAIVRYGPR